MTKGHLLTATISLAIGAGVATVIKGDEAQAIPQDKEELVVQLLNSADITDVERIVRDNTCPAIDKKYKLKKDTKCSIPRDVMGKAVSFFWIPDKDKKNVPYNEGDNYDVEQRARTGVGGGGTWRPGPLRQ